MATRSKKVKKYFDLFLEWLVYLLGYVVVFLLVTKLFSSVTIDKNHPFFYSTLVVLILSILNNTIKPILVTFTIPITGITLGIFYPFINLFILKLVDWMLKSHFELKKFWIALVFAVLLSIVNILMENIIIKPIIRGVKNHGQSSN